MPPTPDGNAIEPQSTKKGKVLGNTQKPAKRPQFKSHLYCPKPLDADFAIKVKGLEAALDMPIWLFVQSRNLGPKNRSAFDILGEEVADAFVLSKQFLPAGKRIALLIDSPGGLAQSAYRIAELIRRRCGGFVAVVPRYAKSAATLLCLGADEVVMGDEAELGPLDAQTYDPERGHLSSALDEVQALERLHAFTLEAVDRHMELLIQRSGMRIRTLLPEVHDFVSRLARPLFEKIDTVHYTMMSRMLKVGEEYAFRLLRRTHGDEPARNIARHLVEAYPEHAFVLDAVEARTIGLRVTSPSVDASNLLDELFPFLSDGMVAFGHLKELEP